MNTTSTSLSPSSPCNSSILGTKKATPPTINGDPVGPLIIYRTITLADGDGGDDVIGPSTIGDALVGATDGGGACSIVPITTHSCCGAHHVMYLTIMLASSIIMIVVGRSIP